MEERKLAKLLSDKIQQAIRVRNLDLTGIQRIICEDEKRVLDLIEGRLDQFTPDSLYNYLLKLSPEMDTQQSCLW